MKKKFVHDWPNIIKDQEVFSNKIVELSNTLIENSKKQLKQEDFRIDVEQYNKKPTEKSSNELKDHLLKDDFTSK